MIGKRHRFQGLGSLRFAYQKGKTVRGQAISMRYILNRRRDTYRVSVVVSKKVHKSAVTRNRIRRRVYEAARESLRSVTEPYDIVFLVYSDQLAIMPAGELQGSIAELLARAGITSR